MGAWSVLAVDNDDANDWAYGLDDVDHLSVVESALDIIEQADDYRWSPDAATALSACEVPARLNGKSAYSNAYTEKVDQWVAAHPAKPPMALRARADAAIDRIFGETSELKELWSDSGEMAQWLASVEDLRGRLQAYPDAAMDRAGITRGGGDGRGFACPCPCAAIRYTCSLRAVSSVG